MKRQHLGLDLDAAEPFDQVLAEGVTARTTEANDREQLVLLMLEAYCGTIDYEGEEMPEAIAEVEGYFSGGTLLQNCSIVLMAADEMVSARLVTAYRDSTIVGAVMTAPAFKRRGLGSAVTVESLIAIREDGHGYVHAFVTEGNTASERIFKRLGFDLLQD